MSDNFSRNQKQRRTPEGLPSPEILEAYDTVLAGSATRIIDMFEREQQHRHQWEHRALKVHQISTLLGAVAWVSHRDFNIHFGGSDWRAW